MNKYKYYLFVKFQIYFIYTPNNESHKNKKEIGRNEYIYSFIERDNWHV